MKKGNMIAVIIVAVLLLGGAAIALTRKSDPKPAATDTASSTTPDESSDEDTADTTPTTSTDTTPPTEEQSSAATITYSDSGFGPATVTVKSGGKVTISNNSSRTIQFNSDPHPSHTQNSELNLGTVAPATSKSFTVTKTGTWGYHNHLNQTETGNIVVE